MWVESIKYDPKNEYSVTALELLSAQGWRYKDRNILGCDLIPIIILLIL